MPEILIINFGKGASHTGSVSHTGRKKISKLGNEKMGSELEESGCASEIKQILNKIKATPCKPAEGLLVYSTLPKFETWAKFEMKKRQLGLLREFGRKRRSSEES